MWIPEEINPSRGLPPPPTAVPSHWAQNRSPPDVDSGGRTMDEDENGRTSWQRREEKRCYECV
ncbi:hypothetical protein RHMOL_Rhmol05G0185100 [Rhododendron molle]|uniref:Uncharacterized protein n=1 Tax=Rhododendron molle TaxID=49168 RepID=A0ACC0NQX6_RHOML|nr:hypothetical protein RHMOL_Rhmol05G0185100 [Rhododendron molle]